jgi:hypothetical protein
VIQCELGGFRRSQTTTSRCQTTGRDAAVPAERGDFEPLPLCGERVGADEDIGHRAGRLSSSASHRGDAATQAR